MFDQILTIVMHHYIVVGVLGIAAGVLLNIAFTTVPEIVHSIRMNKLY